MRAVPARHPGKHFIIRPEPSCPVSPPLHSCRMGVGGPVGEPLVVRTAVNVLAFRGSQRIMPQASGGVYRAAPASSYNRTLNA